ncbi:MAG: GNAT family N-acetyltransferase [Clostridia bacterium]|nr:GNAT family N-acetyltransferase [Clostridia bacterium]
MKTDDPFFYLPLQGKRLRLTALHESDLDLLQDFFQDMESLIYYIPTIPRPLNRKQLYSLLDNWNDGVSNFIFAVRVADQLIGLVNIDGLDWPNSHAEIGIALTEPDMRGQGYATEAIAVLLRYCFYDLGLHRVWARIIEDNTPSIRLFQSLGFKPEGALRQHILRQGQFRDMLFFGILKPEWEELKKNMGIESDSQNT